MFNLPKVEIIKLVDVKDVDWCEEAVLFRVKSGKGTLTHRISEEDEEYFPRSIITVIRQYKLWQGLVMLKLMSKEMWLNMPSNLFYHVMRKRLSS